MSMWLILFKGSSGRPAPLGARRQRGTRRPIRTICCCQLPTTASRWSRPFGANGIAFDNEGTAMFVMNTAYHSIIKIPVKPNGSAGNGVTFTTGLNAPDGVAVDGGDNLW